MCVNLDGTKDKYNKILTPYAFGAVCEQLHKREDDMNTYNATPNNCQCKFFRCMKLPCKHIFKLLDTQKNDLYVPELVAERWTLQYNCLRNIRESAEPSVIASQSTPRKHQTVLSGNQKFRKASTKLQKLASLMAEVGMAEFNEKMECIDQLIHFWESHKKLTLVETTEVGDPHETTETATIADTEEMPELPDIETEISDVPPEIEAEIPGVQPDMKAGTTNVKPIAEFSYVTLPLIRRQRGRPKGTVNWVIGLPKKRKNTEKEGKDEKPRSKKSKVKMNQVVNRIQLTRIPGAEDWVCS